MIVKARVRVGERISTSRKEGSKESMLGEPLEHMLLRALESGQPIRGGITPPLYTDEDSEVLARTDIRTDRFEEARKIMDKHYNTKGVKTKSELADMGDTAKAEGAGEANGTSE